MRVAALADGLDLEALLDSPPEVVVAPALGEIAAADPAAAAHEQVARMLALLQVWLAEPRLTDTRLVITTQTAFAVRDGEQPDPVAAAVCGLIRSAQSEHPGRFLLLDHDSDQDVPWTALLDADEPLVARRDGVTYAPRVVAGHAPSVPSALDPEATTLIVGGTGGIGALLARHLARQGHQHLLLISRSGPDAPGAGELADELGATIVACDASDRPQLQTLLATIAPDRPLRAVIHAAGVLDDATIETLTPEHRVTSWPLGCVSLMLVGLVVLALPARFEGPTLLVIGHGHALSLIDVVGVFPLMVGAIWLHSGLWSRRASIEAWLREQPAIAGGCLFAAGLGLGLLIASGFSAFFWWWAIGALLFGVMHVPLLTAAFRQRSDNQVRPTRSHRESGRGSRG